jgi:hypothetical protein
MKKLLYLIAILSLNVAVAQNKSVPHLENKNGSVQLMVNNQPFLMFSGELHNSSAGSAHYMRSIWSRMAKQNLNTVIAPVSWELVEPQEGVFDFSLVDSMLVGARKENLKLVLIWFASWKNGRSTYVPEWVKTDTKRFPLAMSKNDKPLNVLSTLSKNACDADAKAFSELMKYIKKVDANDHTVLMIQVENEIGILGSIRDYSEIANNAFKDQVPNELMRYLEKNKSALFPALEKVWAANGYKKKGTWEEVFGTGAKYEGEDWQPNYSFYTEEIFMAWNYAQYVGEIAKKGKNQYEIPMYANAWLRQPHAKSPGQYPSGGPLPEVIDIWRAAAPAIDFIAPDIYATEVFDWVCTEFTRSGNPLFIPETKVGPAGAARAFYTFGKYNAMGYAPFGIDGGGLLLSANPDDHSIEKVYGCLKNLEPTIQKYKGSDQMTGLFIDDKKRSDKIDMGDYTVSLVPNSLSGSFGLVGVQVKEEVKSEDVATGLIVLKLAENEFLVAGGIGGSLIHVTKGPTNKSENIGYAAVDEISFENGVMKSHRLNGDETAFGGPVIKAGQVKIFRIKMYGY